MLPIRILILIGTNRRESLYLLPASSGCDGTETLARREGESMFDPYAAFANRIGGNQFGKVQRVFKFTLIDNAKKDFIRRNPTVKVIDMGVGEPEELPPPFVIDTLHREASLIENRIYPNNGTAPFKEAAARYLKRLTGADFDPATEIVHCIGTKSALAQIPYAFINPGDSVVTTAPGYPVLPTVVQWLGGTVHNLALRAANKFLPDRNELIDAITTHRPKILLLNYPNNPTGALAPASFYSEIIELAHKHNFVIVQDAAYADLVYGEPYVSPLALPGGREVTLELFSLSKSYNMQGYRIGFVASSPLLLKAYALVKDNTDNGQFIAVQKAGAKALDEGGAFLEQQRQKYQRRLTRVAKALGSIGLTVTPSPGSFYLYLSVPKQFGGQAITSAQEFTTLLIEKYGIITVPWEEAGPHIRLSMTFEVGNRDFKSEEEVLSAFEKRLTTGGLE
jgi:LL-diaminopimelate aminotransferase